MFQTCWQVVTSRANTTCWRLVCRLATSCEIFTCVAKHFRERGRTKSVLGLCNRNCSYKTHVLERQSNHCIFKQRFRIVHVYILCEGYYNGAQTWWICVCSHQPYPGIFKLVFDGKIMKADTRNKLNIKRAIKNIRRKLKSL